VAGTRLGPYEIIARLGAGGMGEVFRARDTRLDRTVAIKVLSPSLAADDQFRRRFDREARAISSLSHPQICTLYDIGAENETAYLVMEHLDGETLASRLSRGAMPVAEAIVIAIQIADALDAAHRLGIVHRDVKPANIMLVRRPGSGVPSIKLLDFGLARTAPAVSSTADGSIARTHTQGLTDVGAILGTIPYMAPEQLEGLEADTRTDIFALGVVLYEMVTGKRAFEGRTPASLIGAILRDHPPPLAAVQPLAPPALERLVRRCLEKDPDNRWQTARDLGAELRWVSEAPAEMPSPVAAGTPRRRWLERVAWSLVVLALAAALAYSFRPRTTLPMLARATFELPAGFEAIGGGGGLIAISPDGRRIAFSGTVAGTTQIYLRDIDQFEAVPVGGTSGGINPFFSPDGRSLGFIADRTLRTVPITGGAPLTLTGAESRGAAWTNDGTIIFSSTLSSGLSQIPASGGTPQPFTTLGPQERSHRWPSMLPDGRTVLFTIQPADNEFDDALVAVRSLATGEQKVVVRGGSNPHYLASGHLAYGRGGAVLAVPFDLAGLRAGAAPVRVLERVGSVSGSGAVHYAVSASGSLVYFTGDVVQDQSELVWVDRAGASRSASEARRAYLEVALSPDGKRVAASIAAPGGSPDVWVLEMATQGFTKLTFAPTPDIGAAWTPDGRYVSYRSIADGPQLIRKRFDGNGGDDVIAKDSPNISPTLAGAWHKTGDWVAFAPNGDIFVLAVNAERKPVPFLSTPAVEIFPAFSPDGRWIAYQSNETGRFEIYVQPFPATGERWQISTDGGIRPQWARNASELYFRSANRMMAVQVSPGSAFAAGPPQRLFEAPFAATYDVAPDRRFLMVRNSTRGGPTQLRMVLNWSSEVESRLAEPAR
jgi:serine/threonine-protein kinase